MDYDTFFKVLEGVNLMAYSAANATTPLLCTWLYLESAVVLVIKIRIF